jgi:hypothetical protein
MRRLIALALVVTLTLALTAPAAEAGHHVAVGIGTAVAVVLFAPFIIVGSILALLVNRPPVYASPLVVAPAPPAASPTTVQYPHGRYELRGDGIRTAYQWVWIPNPPPPPPIGPPQSQ